MFPSRPPTPPLLLPPPPLLFIFPFLSNKVGRSFLNKYLLKLNICLNHRSQTCARFVT
ncbi:unnamed protein product [Meloidogyne enterolobii]|uniref:Uncharacterized protein n=1 Tax=Meloidogyne enterolobii TaxID=390850 RepID=A0ACB0YG55_MELEN